jgi:hypothetical protein
MFFYLYRILNLKDMKLHFILDYTNFVIYKTQKVQNLHSCM